MKAETIRQAFAKPWVGPDIPIGGLRRAAALVPLEPERGVWLTRRSAFLATHAGQVSFPGGKIEISDASAEAAALREAHEEVGLEPSKVDIVGRLQDYKTVTGFHIISIVALVPVNVVLNPDRSEVDDFFCLPFSVLLNPDYPVLRRAIIRGVERSFWVWPHENHVIWGATAAILRYLALRLRGGL